MKSRFFVVIALIGAFFYCASPIFISIANADITSIPMIGRGRILHLTGMVEVKSPGESAWKMTKSGAWLVKGSELKTGPESSCDVGLGDNRHTVVRMDANSRTTLSDLDPEVIRLKLEEGRVWARVRDLNVGSRFEVVSPTAVATARGTAWEQSVEEVNVFENTVEVAGADGEIVVVEEGFGVDIDPTGDVKEPEKLPDEKMGDWGNIEKQVESSIAGEANLPSDPSGEEPKPESATSDDPNKRSDNDTLPGMNPPDDPNTAGDPGPGPHDSIGPNDPNDMMDPTREPFDPLKDAPEAPENAFDSFGDGFGSDGFRDPSDTNGGGPGSGDTLGDIKEERHENQPPPTFDPNFKPPCSAGSTTAPC